MDKFKTLFLIILAIISVSIIVKIPTKLGLDLEGGLHLILQANETNEQKLTRDAVLGSIEVIRNRIDKLGLTEPIIRIKGEDKITVELPGIKNPEQAKELIGKTALLEFIEAEWPINNFEALTKEEQRLLVGDIDNLKIEEYTEKNSAGEVISSRPILLKNIVLTGADLLEANPGTDQRGNPIVNLEFNKEGAIKFENATRKNIGKPLAILLDKTIISAPNVNDAIIGGRAQISGQFTVEEVKNLVIKLNAGALPIPVEIISEKVIGPTLGKDSIEKSKNAFIIGLICIIFYMIFTYRLPGLLSSVALFSYIVFAFSLFKLLNATLTLPGIAGFILTIGMAVDANVIIFERIKEELKSESIQKHAITKGFNKAYITIIDANITTLIAAAVLFWLGTGSIKGFAVALTIGICVSMFSAITITKQLLLSFPNLKLFNGVIKNEKI